MKTQQISTRPGQTFYVLWEKIIPTSMATNLERGKSIRGEHVFVNGVIDGILYVEATQKDKPEAYIKKIYISKESPAYIFDWLIYFDGLKDGHITLRGVKIET